MKTFIEAAGIECGKAFFSFRDHGYRNLIAGLSFHHVMVQDELMLVFQDAHFDSQLNRYACFTFADPFGVGFKNGAYFLFVRNDFAFDNTTVNLACLALDVLEVAFNFNLLQQPARSSRSQLG